MRVLALALWLCFALPSRAAEFPYADPYFATITTAILKADHLDVEGKYRDLKLPGLPARDSTPYYGSARNHLKLRLWAQKSPAPLIVMVAGLGGAATASYNNYLGYQFYKRGYHVLTFPSPFHWSFALAASTSGFPGVTRHDAQDLLATIKRGIELVRAKGVKTEKIGLLGVSMGALEAAYLSEIDENLFSRILLINPPVDPRLSALTLDALKAEGAGMDKNQQKNLQENIYLFGIKAMAMNDLKSPDYFTKVEQELPITLAERKFLIGRSLSEFLEALIFTTQQVRNLSVLQTPVAIDKPDDRLKESATFSYNDYLEKFLLPALGKTYAEVEGDVTMFGLETHLRRDSRVRLMHNEDDFILNPGEQAWLQGVFGERMNTYPHGGHVGNLWWNLEFILGSFESLR